MRTKLLVAMMAAVVAMCASARKPNYDEFKIRHSCIEGHCKVFRPFALACQEAPAVGGLNQNSQIGK